jgi:hypothetical protein
MTKSLNQLLADAKQEQQTLSTLLPYAVIRQVDVMRTQVGIDGVLIKDLQVGLEVDGHRFTTAQIKNALIELGWESFTAKIPGRFKRVRVWVKKVQIAKHRRPSTNSNDPEERRLAKLMNQYIDPTNKDFQPEFKAWVDAFAPEA